MCALNWMHLIHHTPDSSLGHIIHWLESGASPGIEKALKSALRYKGGSDKSIPIIKVPLLYGQNYILSKLTMLHPQGYIISTGNQQTNSQV